MSIDWIGTFGLLFSIVGVALSIIQTVRFQEAKKNLEKAKRSRNATIWHNINLTLNTYETLDDARRSALEGTKNHANPILLGKLSSARRSVVDQYLDLIKEAVLDEEDFSESTITYWQSIGRLENDWRVKQAKKFLMRDSSELKVTL